MDKKRKRIIKTSVFITSIVVIFMSVAYAFINLTLEGTKRQVITAGNLELILDEDENNLYIENALPMYDEVGILQEAFTFKIVNNGSLSAKYLIGLEDITTDSKLNTSIVKFNLVKNKKSSIDLLSNLENNVIDSGYILSNETIEYELRFWIDSSVIENDIIKNKSLSYRLMLNAEPVSVCTYDVGTVWEFDYSGKEEEFKVPCDGNYKLEVWGAQGADVSDTYYGGKGGYSEGDIKLLKDSILYINVGGEGGKYTYKFNTASIAPGGYNGGGNGMVNSSGSTWTYRYLYAGGGATHIATKSGLLSKLENNQEDILIVAGGGGSASSQFCNRYQVNGYWTNIYSHTIGGSGGGYEGADLILVSRYWACGVEDSNSFFSIGGSQTSGGLYFSCGVLVRGTNAKFGEGIYNEKSVNELFNISALWGGGGGYYGGSSGAGGSGYIGNKFLDNKAMYCYECKESSDIHTKTISIENVSEIPIDKYAKLGNGYAKIIFLGD